MHDLWKDTMNIASRVESISIPSCIQITKAVVEHTKHEFKFESRSKITVKGKGEIETYFLLKLKKTCS